jgi:hypothetical protein
MPSWQSSTLYQQKRRTVEAIPGNWNAMQHLPAARETINKLLQNIH